MKSEHATEMEFNCDDCSFQVDGEFELRKHINVAHKNLGLGSEEKKENAFPCHSCGKTFSSKWNLIHHRKEEHFNREGVHQPISSFTCDQCDERFAIKSQLEIHMKSEHTTEMEFNCDDCEHCTTTCCRKTDLRLHMEKLHTSERPMRF